MNARPLPIAHEDRRAWPRSPASGLRLDGLAGAHIVDISPYGARLALDPTTPVAPILQFGLCVPRRDLHTTVKAQVAGREGQFLRLRFVSLDGQVQRELGRLSRAWRLVETIQEGARMLPDPTLAEGAAPAQTAPAGFRFERDPHKLQRWWSGLQQSQARLTLGLLHDGRPLHGTVRAVLQDRIQISLSQHPGSVPTEVCISANADHESDLVRARTLDLSDRVLTIAAPAAIARTDRRAAPRLPATPGSWVELDGQRYPVSDVSEHGLGIRVPTTQALSNGRHTARVGCGPEAGRPVLLIPRNRHPASDGQDHVGALVLPADSRTVAPIRHLSAHTPGTLLTDAPVTPATRVDFKRLDGSKPVRVVGLWQDTGGPGPATVVVLPPAWARTKESTSLLSQLLCASFRHNHRRLVMLRLDYVNGLGASSRDPRYDQAGHEARGVRPSSCVADIRAAIDFALSRIDGPSADVAVIGMSFSGPLCLRAAATHPAVTWLGQLMGASDLQDLIRTSTGGIDYVARHRAGLRSHTQNVLGMLSDTDIWCADGRSEGLLTLADALTDAARLECNLLWVHGDHDAFVNGDRIDALLAASGTGGTRVTVPTGHIPTRTDEAVLAGAPIVRALLESAGVPPAHHLAIPCNADLADVRQQEWALAPRTTLASPESYWRTYMLGDDADDLGFDILAATREYQSMMALQADLLAGPGERLTGTLVDLGGGMGHALPHLAQRSTPDLDVHLLDLVPELARQAARRGQQLGLRTIAVPYDAAADAIPEVFDTADTVLMSLFLSVLPNPAAFLAQLVPRLPAGARVVASSVRPDADLSEVYVHLLQDVASGKVTPPAGWTSTRFADAIRAYMSSAAWLLRLAEEGTFTLFDGPGLAGLLTNAGLEVERTCEAMGTPSRAVVVSAIKR